MFLGTKPIYGQAFYRLKWSSRKHKKDSIIIGKKRRHVSIVKIQQKLCFRGQKWGFGGQIYTLLGFLSTQMKVVFLPIINECFDYFIWVDKKPGKV